MLRRSATQDGLRSSYNLALETLTRRPHIWQREKSRSPIHAASHGTIRTRSTKPRFPSTEVKYAGKNKSDYPSTLAGFGCMCVYVRTLNLSHVMQDRIIHLAQLNQLPPSGLSATLTGSIESRRPDNAVVAYYLASASSYC